MWRFAREAEAVRESEAVREAEAVTRFETEAEAVAVPVDTVVAEVVELPGEWAKHGGERAVGGGGGVKGGGGAKVHAAVAGKANSKPPSRSAPPAKSSAAPPNSDSSSSSSSSAAADKSPQDRTAGWSPIRRTALLKEPEGRPFLLVTSVPFTRLVLKVT